MNSEASADPAALIRVVTAIELPGLDTFLVVADVESGSVRPRMELVVPIGTTAKRTLTIHGVGSALGGGASRIGLAFEAAAWARLAGMGDRAMSEGSVLEVRHESP